MDEYISIAEAARRIGLSDKTIRRAIHAGKLEARYPHKNRAEVSLQALHAWYSTLYVRPGETEDRLAALESQATILINQWQKTREAIDILEVLQETLKFEVVTQLGKFATILKEQGERLEQIEKQLTDLQSKKKTPPKLDTALPDGFVWLSDFCIQHYVPYPVTLKLFPHAIHGQKIGSYRRNYPALGPRGRRDFWIQLHDRPDFRACDDCPHAMNDQGV